MKPQKRGMITCNCFKINVHCNSEALEFTNKAFTFFEVEFGINTMKKFITNILFYTKVCILGYGLKQIKN